MVTVGNGIARRSLASLAGSIRLQLGTDAYGPDGRLRDPCHALVAGLDPGLITRAVGLNTARLRQPETAAVIAVNSFLGWLRDPEQLILADRVGFTSLRFAARCPTGVRGTPPHLDVLAVAPDGVVAVLARGTEHLAARRARIAKAYAALRPPPELRPWAALLGELRGQLQQFKHLDAGGVARHALALGQLFPNRPVTLLYLFWEPDDAAQHRLFSEHRAELRRLLEHVADAAVMFRAQSFAELWESWARRAGPAWLPAVLEALRSRYCVTVAG